MNDRHDFLNPEFWEYVGLSGSSHPALDVERKMTTIARVGVGDVPGRATP